MKKQNLERDARLGVSEKLSQSPFFQLTVDGLDHRALGMDQKGIFRAVAADIHAILREQPWPTLTPAFRATFRPK